MNVDPTDLVDRYLDHRLEDAEAERLMAWLREDPCHVRELVRAAKLHCDLRYAVISRAERAGTPVATKRSGVLSQAASARLEAKNRPRRLSAWRGAGTWLIAAAASLIASFGSWSLLPRTGAGVALAEVVAVSSDPGPRPMIVHREARPGDAPSMLNTGSRIGSGDRIVTAGATVSLRCVREATTFDLAAGTTVSVAGESGPLRIALDRGSLRASVAKQAPGSVLSLRTPHALAEVIGTEFVLAVDAEATRLDVSEGRVRFTRLHEGTVSDVTAGERASSDVPVVSPYERWSRGPSHDPAFFPIGVWMQEPSLAGRYREAGITMYVGLPRGTTEVQLETLRSSGMPVVCEQDGAALGHVGDRIIIGWLAPSRPDDAPSAAEGDRSETSDRISTIGAGAFAPIPPDQVVERYRADRDRDATRPNLLGLGAGAAWDGWYGRGTRTGHAEDYPRYLQGCDIAAFAIDPLAQPPRGIAGRMWYIGDGVDRLRKWGEEKPVWCFLSCARTAAGLKPTADELRSAAWMALIHGAKGLIYAQEPAKAPAEAPAIAESQMPTLLDDPGMAADLTAIDRRIAALAPALNGPTLPPARVESSNAEVEVATLLKRDASARYLFAVAMRAQATTATFTVSGLEDGDVVDVLDEQRRITPRHGSFSDAFTPFGVHLYALSSPAATKPQGAPHD